MGQDGNKSNRKQYKIRLVLRRDKVQISNLGQELKHSGALITEGLKQNGNDLVIGIYLANKVACYVCMLCLYVMFACMFACYICMLCLNNLLQMQQQEEGLKVAPILSQPKMQQLRHEILSTIVGLQSNLHSQLVINIIIYLLIPAIVILIPIFVNIYLVGILLPTFAAPLIILLRNLILKEEMKVHRYLCLGLFCLLWSNHMYALYHSTNNTGLLIISCISILTSCSTVSLRAVKQFALTSPMNETLQVDSTLYMRLLIALPTLVAEFILDQLTSVNQASPYLYGLRLASSLVCLIWWLGWLSSLSNTSAFIIDRINSIVFGDQRKTHLLLSFLSLVFNIIPIIIYSAILINTANPTLLPLIIGVTITNLLSLLISTLFSITISSHHNTPRIICCILFEILICIAFCLLYTQTDLNQVNLTIFLTIDVALYILFAILKEFLVNSRSILGFGCENQNSILKQTLLFLGRWSLRAVSGFCVLVVMVQFGPVLEGLFNLQYSQMITNCLIPILGYRSFKRCTSQTLSFFHNVSFLICLILINTGYGPASSLAVLLMVSYNHNIFLIFQSVFAIPPKARHPNQCCYQMMYLLVNLLGVAIDIITLGAFDLTMIFGLPVYFPMIPTATQGFQVKSVQNSLYMKMVQNIKSQTFRFFGAGFYLLRIQKYLLLVELKCECYGFCEIICFKGLEVQQVTSCHSKEGETVDKLVEETWGDNKLSCSFYHLSTVLAPIANSKLFVQTQNLIQLTGILEAPQFVQFFKNACIKAFIRAISTLTLTPNHKKQADLILSEFQALFKKQQAEKIFPFDFAQKCKLKAIYPLQLNKKKLPPLKAVKKNEVLNDFLDLIENSQQNQQSVIQLDNREPIIGLTQSKVNEERAEEWNFSLVMTMYYYTVGKQDYFNSDKFYKIVQMEADAVNQIDFDTFPTIASRCLGSAFKISIEKYINGQENISLQDFQQYSKNSFLGTSNSQDFKQAILNEKEDIWTVSLAKRTLAVKRLSKAEANMYMFKVDETIVKSVWNNLRFQLLYATNDNDERYSIQTHPTLLRNLWVEACDSPFGYPSYSSGNLLNI